MLGLGMLTTGSVVVVLDAPPTVVVVFSLGIKDDGAVVCVVTVVRLVFETGSGCGGGVVQLSSSELSLHDAILSHLKFMSMQMLEARHLNSVSLH